MKVLMLSTDSKILEEGSVVRARMVEYGMICDELHVVIPTYNLQPTTYNHKIQISHNVFVYTAVASNKISALWKACSIGINVLPTTYNLQPTTWLVTSQDPFETGFVAWYISRKISTKLELQIHTDFLSPYFWRESLINKARVILARFLLPRADGIRAVSNRIARSLNAKPARTTANSVQSGGRYALKAIPTILPIFVDTEKIKNTLPSVDLHKKYPQFDFIILMASRLSKEKNINLAFEAMKEVVSKYPKTGLVIVGSGPEEKNLKLKAKSCKLTANVIFEPWSDDVVLYMKTADCFLLTSNYEGFGLSLVEAAASGCPIVTTDVGLVGDTFGKDNEIIVCSVGDKNCITEGLRNLLTHPDIRRSFSLSVGKSIEVLNMPKERYLTSMKAAWEKCV